MNLKSQYKARRDLIVARAECGCEVVHVHLTRGAVAVIERPVFERLMSFGISPNWYFNKDGSGKYPYVRVDMPAHLELGNNGTVSRLIVAPIKLALLSNTTMAML